MNDLPFIDPTRGMSRAQLAPAPRPMDLRGKIVGLLDNTKEQGDVILEAVADALRSRYGVAQVVLRRKQYYSKPAPAEMVDEMAQEVQVAVAALGG